MHTYCLFFGILSDFSASNPPHFFPIRELKNRVNVSCSAFIFVVTRKVIINYYFLDTFNRASDISRKKKQNFVGFSGANSRKNRPISRDFRGKKVKIRGTIGRFQAIFAGEKSKFAGKSAHFEGF